MYIQAGFVAAIQSQLMSTTISITQANETTAFHAVNAFFTGGLVLDIMAAMLGYLTGRWLERLTEEEKKALDENLTIAIHSVGRVSPPHRDRLSNLFITPGWLCHSSFRCPCLLVASFV
jgi:hypothetical protein